MQTAIQNSRNYFDEIWRCRYFWLTLAINDLRCRYRRSIVGIGWSLLQPIAMTAVLCVAFHQIFHTPIREYAPWLMTGMAIWTYISSVVSDGCQTFYRSEGYIRSHSAPLGIYPLRVVLGVSFHFLLTVLITMVLTWTVQGGVNNPLALLSLVPSLLLLFCFGWAVSVITGFANVYFPDTQHLSMIGLQILFYLTPVMYPPHVMEKIKNNDGMSMILAYNPLGSLVHLVRDPITIGAFPSMTTYLIAGSMTAVLVAVALLILVKLQNYLIFHL